MVKQIASILLFVFSCGHSENEGSKVAATVNSKPASHDPQKNADRSNDNSPKPGTPESATEISFSCNTGRDCSVIPSYCGGFKSVNTSSVSIARTHYDAIGQIKNCRQGKVSPPPQAYCENEHCEPTAWNEGYAIHFSESVDFRHKSHFEGQPLSPFATSRAEKGEALIALRTKLELNHPNILAKSTDYHVQYMGAKIGSGDNPFLLGNFFCRANGIDWHKEWVIVDDGGPCYFQFKYDLVTKKLIEFTVNGES